MLIFTHISDHAGGVQSLIINLSEELARNGIDILIIDKSNGFVKKSMDNLAIQYKFCDINSVAGLREFINSSDVYISFGNFETDFSILKLINIRVFYWQVHPDFLSLEFKIRSRFIPKKFYTNNFITKFFRTKLYNQLIQSNAMSIMSISHLKFAHKSEIKYLSKNIIPIPVNNVPQILPKRRNDDDYLNVVYIGRPQDWKVLPFTIVLNDINKLEEVLRKRIIVYVVTTDNQLFEQYIKNYCNDNRVKIIYKLGLAANSLDEFLKSTADVVFSMGTSLLESAKFGIPSLFADACFNNYIPKNYKYRFLFETKGYNLGNPIYSENDVLDGITIKEVFDRITNKNDFEFLRNSCFDYVIKNHEIKTTSTIFLEKTVKTSLLSKDIYWLDYFFKGKRFIKNKFKF